MRDRCIIAYVHMCVYIYVLLPEAVNLVLQFTILRYISSYVVEPAVRDVPPLQPTGLPIFSISLPLPLPLPLPLSLSLSFSCGSS